MHIDIIVRKMVNTIFDTFKIVNKTKHKQFE